MKYVNRLNTTVAIALSAVLGLPMLAMALQTTKPGGEAKAVSGLEQLAWLAGSWLSENDRSVSEEQWMKPRAGTMIGMNRTIAKPPDARASDGKASERTVFFEFLRIEQNKDGIVYLASPKGRQPATPFKMKEVGEHSVVFENPEHDFPRRITYRLEGDIMHARVEGTQGGKMTSEEWTWQRSGS